MDKLKIIIAGPGAGKTFNLKGEVINCLQNLDINRFCAVITYTNAATTELRLRISSEISIPPNVFIGTIHSFLIRFVIEPFGHIIGLVPISKNYIDNVKSDDPMKKNAIQKMLSDKGVITYDKVLHLSKEIIKTKLVKKLLINRLQFLFIDEYQDSHKNTHEFFKQIIKHTKLSYLIGDKLQYIYAFNCKASKRKDLSATSFADLTNSFPNNISKIVINYRSSQAIVNLINNFIEDDFKQTSNDGDNNIPIYFIDKTIFSEIYDTYNRLKNKHNINNMHNTNLNKSEKPFLKDFILTRNWIDNENSKKKKLKDIYNTIKGESVKLEKGNHRVNGILQEVSRCILAITGVKKQDFIISTFNELEYRKFCFEIARCLKSKHFNNYEERINSIKNQFLVKFNCIDNTGKQVDVENTLIELSNKSSNNLSHNPESCYSSIHSAKGLEATSVLAIASSSNELEKWLDFKEANNNLCDDYRLGYVAFSRARDMLCISCLDKITPKIKNKLESLKIVFCSN